MNIDELVRDSLARTASAQPAPAALHSRSVAYARRLRNRRRTAGALASVGVVAAGAVGGYAALPSRQATAPVGSSPAAPSPLSEVLAQMAAAPDTTGSAVVWFRRETTTKPGARAFTIQQWVSRDGSAREEGTNKTFATVPAGGMDVAIGQTGGLTWAQAHALPTDPSSLSAALAAVVASEPAVASPPPASPSASSTALASLDLLASGPGAPPAVRAAAIELLSQTAGVQIQLDTTDATGRPGLAIQVVQGARLERWVIDAHTGQELEYQALSPKLGSLIVQIDTDASAPVPSDHALPDGVGVMVQPAPGGGPASASPSASSSASAR